MPTPSMEDYLERIYKLIDEKGYARVSDIAEGLEVHPSSVTKMIQKLDKDEYLIYEKYRGLVLTSKGKSGKTSCGPPSAAGGIPRAYWSSARTYL